MARKRISLTLAALIVFFVILLALISIRITGLGDSLPNPVGSLLRETLAPLQSGVTSATNDLRDRVAGIWELRKAKQENDELRAQLELLSKENNQLKQKILAGMRFEELEKKFNSPTIWNYSNIGAAVTNRNPSNWYHTVEINRGSKDGVKVDNPVVTNLGLVGKVIAVTANTSEVVLLVDPEGQVSGTVRQSQGSASFGVVVGEYKRGPSGSGGSLKMTVPKDDKVNPGDLVLTSGMGGVYPKEIPVGVIQEVSMETGGLLKTATILPLVQFDRLEEVFVVLTGVK